MSAESFLANYSVPEDLNSELLNDPHFRESIYKSMHPKPVARFFSLARKMLDHEVTYRQDENHDGEYFENIYWVGLFLYQIGDLNDVVPMWRAKQTNMDTGGGFDIQFLVGCGVMETIDFLRIQRDPECDSIASYIEKCRDAGDFDNLNEWLEDRIEYFS